MAFSGYIGQNTYTVVDNVAYSKIDKTLRFDLFVFNNNTKTVMLASKQYNYWFVDTIAEIQGINATVPPENPVNGEQYIISKTDTPTGVWADKAGLIAVWKDDMNDWSYWYSGPGNKYYYSVDDKYYEITDDQNNYKSYSFANDSRSWDKWFSPAKVLLDEESNIYKQIYLFLKTQPGFENITSV